MAELATLVDETQEYGELIVGFEFSVTMADPMQADCPLIAVSHGFTSLTGYEAHEVVGTNCRFMIDYENIDTTARERTREYIQECRTLMPEGKLPDDMLVEQSNVKKDGTTFRNGFLMHASFLSDGNRPVIFALQNNMGQETGAVHELAAGRLVEVLAAIFYELPA